MKSFIFAHFGWKLLSLGIATALWLAIVDEPVLLTSQPVPIFYTHLPKNLEIGSEVPDRVHLEVSGPARKLTSESLAETSVRIDLSRIQHPGVQTFTINTSNIDLPDGVTFLRAMPSQLRLRFERYASRAIPVDVRFAGPPPLGYRVARKEVQPETLQIGGPEDRVSQIEFAQTDPVDIGNVFGEAQFRVNTYVVDPQVRFESSPMVTVKIWMEKIPQNPHK
ncbi:MAG TPA: CdaR family protein [Bryobacteraceae bacterium]|nr:CdaR family protein [Bryobacteraceae bacterium]